MNRRGRWLAVIVALAGGLGLMVYLVEHSRFIDIDRCLDAGGAWNHAQDLCETE
jgi:hypothetical protein